MKIIKNASLAISSKHKKNYFPLDAPFTFIMSRACLYLWHGMINVYLYLCMFCCCFGKKNNLYFTVVKLKRYNSLCLPKGLSWQSSTYTRRSSKQTHIWGRWDLLLKIKISLFRGGARGKFPTRAIFSCHLPSPTLDKSAKFLDEEAFAV